MVYACNSCSCYKQKVCLVFIKLECITGYSSGIMHVHIKSMLLKNNKMKKNYCSQLCTKIKTFVQSGCRNGQKDGGSLLQLQFTAGSVNFFSGEDFTGRSLYPLAAFHSDCHGTLQKIIIYKIHISLLHVVSSPEEICQCP